MRPSLRAELRARLQDIGARDLTRRRRLVSGAHGVQLRVDGRETVNFCSNDYLGLAADPRLATAMARAARQLGSGSGASQLITGYNAEHAALEEELAAATGCERALLFATGYAANMGVIEALVGKRDTIVADALNHASLIDGARLSGADKKIYPHTDVAGARRALRECPDGRRLLLTDTVFSMDGDMAPLVDLADLAEQQDAWLMVDDAHGFGVLDDTRVRALASDVYIATLGKAVGAAGAFVAGEGDLIEYLVQSARTLIFSTAPPPAVAAAARTGLHLMQEESWRRWHLHGLIARFKAGAAQLDLPLAHSSTPIQPLMIGGEADALAVSNALLEYGYLVSAIRPPTVPVGTARLRITLSAGHAETQVDGLLEALAAAMASRQPALASQ